MQRFNELPGSPGPGQIVIPVVVTQPQAPATVGENAIVEVQNIQLDDLLAVYPNQSTPGIQTIITRKKEFNELASFPQEAPPSERGKYFKHQLYVQRLLRALDDQILIHETGTGKTCSVAAFTEWAYDQWQQKKGNIKRVFVLVKGPVQKNEFKNQMTCRCSRPDRYETINVRTSNTEKQQKTNVTLAIKKWYNVRAYRAFSNMITREYPDTPEGDARIVEDFSDCVFWIDEAHNLRISSVLAGDGKVKNRQYDQIHRVMHLIQRSKRIISTATPMVNTIWEIIPLMNLILPRDGVLPEGYDYWNRSPLEISVLFPTLPADVDYKRAPAAFMAPLFKGQMPRDLDLTQITLERIEPYFRGRISYVRALDTGAVSVFVSNDIGSTHLGRPYPIGNEIYYLQTRLFGSAMTNLQNFGTAGGGGGGGMNQARKVSDRLLRDEVQASNFVYPDGWWGSGQTEEERREAKTRRQRIKQMAKLQEQIGATPFISVPVAPGPPANVFSFEGQHPVSTIIGPAPHGFTPAAPAFAGVLLTQQPPVATAYIPTPSAQTGAGVTGGFRPAPYIPAQAGGFRPAVPAVAGTGFQGFTPAPVPLALPATAGAGAGTQAFTPFRAMNLGPEEPPPALEQDDDVDIDYGRDEGPEPDIALPVEPGEDRTKYRAYRRFVIEEEDGRYRATDEFIPYLQSPGTIRNCSCKFAEIVNLVMRPGSGSAFVYSGLVVSSGVITMALCFDNVKWQPDPTKGPNEQSAFVGQNAFERFDESTSVFVGLGNQNVRPYCGGTGGAGRQLKEKFQKTMGREPTPEERANGYIKKYRYALLTHDTTDAKFASMMEAMNSYENRHGDIIKALISSPVGRDAINVFNVLQIHLADAEWTESAIYQARSRALRATSHIDLINEEVERLIRQGVDPSLARLQAKVEVKIYYHAAFTQDDYSADAAMYRNAERKDREIRKIFRMMKQCATDCYIHRARNVRPTDIEGSQTCDYESCNYPCVNPYDPTIDYTTYNVYYADEVVEAAIIDIRKFFQKVARSDFQHIVGNIARHEARHRFFQTEQREAVADVIDYEPRFLAMALERLITDKQALLDKYGYPVYLQEDRGVFFLVRNYPARETSVMLSTYSSSLIAIRTTELIDVAYRVQEVEQAAELEQLEKLPPVSVEFQRTSERLNVSTRSLLFENVFLRYLRGERSPFIDQIFKVFAGFWYEMPEQVTSINKCEGPGGPKLEVIGEGGQVKVERITEANQTELLLDRNTVADQDPNNPGQRIGVIYIHTIYTTEKEGVKYATMAKISKCEGRIRILKQKEGIGWRDCSPCETYVYNRYCQLEFLRRREDFNQMIVYGVEPQDKADIVTIIDWTGVDRAAARADVRRRPRGQACINYKVHQLIRIAWLIQMNQPTYQAPMYDRNRVFQFLASKKHLREDLEDNTNGQMDAKLQYYYAWWMYTGRKTGPKKEDLCHLIREWMIKTGRIAPA
jgi:hypothetical protein